MCLGSQESGLGGEFQQVKFSLIYIHIHTHISMIMCIRVNIGYTISFVFC